MSRILHFVSSITVMTSLVLSLGVVVSETPAQAAGPGRYDRRTAIVEAVEVVGPAVVNISTEQLGEQVHDPLQHMFGFPYHPRFYKRRSIGSGLIFSSEGYVVTNAHVVEKAVSEIKVTTIDGKDYPADVIGVSAKFDIAVLKVAIPEDELHYRPLSCSDDLLIGESVIAIGNSLGLSHTVTTGIVSAVNRSFRVDDRLYRDFIQTDASINPGNSGGPLLNINGDVIGINTAIFNDSEGIGFAIPSQTVQRIIDDLLAYGETRSPWFGVFVQDLSPTLRSYLEYEGMEGVMVSEVFRNSPGAQSGLEAGDLILELNGRKVMSVEDYRTIMTGFTYNETISIKVLRDGKNVMLSMRGAAFPEDLILNVVWEWLGFKMVENTPQLARKHRLPDAKGVVVSEIKEGSRAESIGLNARDIIWQVNRVKVKEMDGAQNAFVQAINQNASEVTLVVQRGRRLYYISL